MGTSHSYGGPGPGDDLLPPDAPPPPNEEEQEPDSPDPDPDRPEEADEADDQDEGQGEDSSPSSWKQTKGAMTRYSRAGGSSSETGRRNLRKAARGFVSNQGGSRGATAGSRAGRAAATSLGRFATDIARSGWTEAVSNLGLTQYVDQGVDVLVAALVEKLSPSAGHIEEDLTRKAMAATLARVIEDGATVPSPDSLDEEGVREVLTSFVVEYVDQRLMHVLGDRIEINAANEKEAIAQEKEIRDFVERDVERLDFDRDLLQVDWEGNEGSHFIDEVFNNAYQLLGEE